MTNLEIGFNTLARQNWFVKIITEGTPLFKSMFIAIAIPPTASIIEDRVNLSIAHMEEHVIKIALIVTGNDKTAAAKRLGISKVTLYRKLKTYGIMPERDEPVLIGA